MTVGARMKETGGRTTGFDYLRITLAVSIILWHGLIISYGSAVEGQYWQGPAGIAFRFVLPMFFALSGFLVAGSLDRCKTLVSFFALRLLRIVPALAVEVFLSALIFGPLLTSKTIGDYVSSPLLASYFLNLIGDIHYILPGLFEHNPNPNVVNNQLWTVPFELQCYLVLGGLAAVSLMRRRWLLLGMTVLAQLLWIVEAHKLVGAGPMLRAPLAPGQVLVIAFLCGILLHLFRDRVPLTRTLFFGCLAAGVALACLPNGGIYLPFPATYLTVYLGLLNPPTNGFLKSGDYSYGLFLYGYPIQQAVAAIGPETRHWWINVGIALPAALAVAVVSWRVIEKPALGKRRSIPAIEAWLVARVTTNWTSARGALSEWRLVLAMGVLGGVALLINGNEILGSALIAVAMAGSVLRPAPVVQAARS